MLSPRVGLLGLLPPGNLSQSSCEKGSDETCILFCHWPREGDPDGNVPREEDPDGNIDGGSDQNTGKILGPEESGKQGLRREPKVNRRACGSPSLSVLTFFHPAEPHSLLLFPQLPSVRM